jgi:hypothetical protein
VSARIAISPQTGHLLPRGLMVTRAGVERVRELKSSRSAHAAAPTDHLSCDHQR